MGSDYEILPPTRCARCDWRIVGINRQNGHAVIDPLDHRGHGARLRETANAPHGAIVHLSLSVGLTSLLRNIVPGVGSGHR